MLTRDERTPTYGEDHVAGEVDLFIESTFASRYVVCDAEVGVGVVRAHAAGTWIWLPRPPPLPCLAQPGQHAQASPVHRWSTGC